MLRQLLSASTAVTRRLPRPVCGLRWPTAARSFADEATALKDHMNGTAGATGAMRSSASQESSDELNAKIDDLLAGILNSVPKPTTTTVSETLTQFDVKKPELPEDLRSALRFGMVEEDLAETSELTRRIFSFDNASQSEINRYRITKAIQKLQRKPYDTGSVEAQVAGMTERIKYLTEHMKTHKKDFNSLRGLVGIVNQRRKLMEYLKRKNYGRFKALKNELSLRIAD